jgi:hypothetical protein
MPDSIESVGVIAEVATAAAAVTYPLVKAMRRYLEQRRAQQSRRLAAATAVIEARLHERCVGLEQRIDTLEQRFRDAA